MKHLQTFESFAQSLNEAKPVKCTVEMVRDGVALTGGSMEYDGEEEQTVVYFKMEGSDEIFVLTNTFE